MFQQTGSVYKWKHETTGVENKDRPAYKVHLTPTEDVQDETLISVWKLHILETRFYTIF